MENTREQVKYKSRSIIAVHGSKGGCGSSMVASNLGIFLAQIGKDVLLIDANLSNGGLCHWLGQAQPEKNIADVILKRVDKIADAVVDTSITNLYLLASAPSLSFSELEKENRIEQFIKQIENVQSDYIIIDLDSNVEKFTLDLYLLADYSISVTLPMPDSIESTYNFISAAFTRGLLHIFSEEENSAVASFFNDVSHGIYKTPRNIIDETDIFNKELALKIKRYAQLFHPLIIVNQVKLKEDEYIGDAMISASTRWLGIVPILVGSIGWDDNVWLSQRRAKPLLINFSGSRACKDLEEIVRNITGLVYRDLITPFVIPPKTEVQNYYELLEIYPGASEEEVRRAYKQIKTWFGIDGIAVRGLCPEKERTEFQKLADFAHSQLVDKSKRRKYDKDNFPNGFSVTGDSDIKPRESIAGKVAATHDSLPRIELAEDQFVGGHFLGEIRKKHNVELVDISNRAKIAVRYLQAIEEERYKDLPAAVFTRGFVTEFARFLKIDSHRAASDFMTAYTEYFKKKRK
ncbi:MAG: helix-turn-helix domain-containing protein [Deltaproteobacteria bacterium]|nr:helix-turn-helix domain-containing protein [Deltaproteobacteria bacterium]